ncbi:hypothetical protein [Novosphingobium mangrovi (ex Hu et al. 2023)]|uniref:Uncharacterized protein n=1 Tax=Novosphingobium mangrovi (ex Hu et al. 2023) TaxID=2930094 RepID=A0ABT0AEB2_9SPHN|nr:hypothetical protein [Novosphingobium mangrovi (ex Hu et al. 2023)]MCJ1961520.1 hypothetical protein [Novosphingobium mangrovi (ex Hu et al. 2023)]
MSSPSTPPAHRYLEAMDTEDLARMVMSLLSELWITRDRLAVVEELLEDKGVLETGSVESFEWTPEREPKVEALRDRMIASVMGAPLAAKERTYQKILERAGFTAE